MRLHIRGVVNGVISCLILLGLIMLGSRQLSHFDAALIPYLFGTLFAVFGSVYRYSVWLSRPPTKVVWQRSLSLVFSPGFVRHALIVLRTFVENMVLQRFIGRRSPYRWVMHFLLAWGCLLAFAVTFPLVFGWLHFETPLDQANMYQIYVFGFPTTLFDPYGLFGFFIFNALNFCSVMIIIGVIMAFTRRFRHPGELTTQSFAHDLLPLLILFAVATTGLFLTYNTHFLNGHHYRVLSTIHCWTVVLLLVYLPFGKFFHIFQRAAQMGASLYIAEKENGAQARCPKSGEKFTSAMQKYDVKRILEDSGFQFQVDGQLSIQDLSPESRRKLIMFAQNKRVNGQFDIQS